MLLFSVGVRSEYLFGEPIASPPLPAQVSAIAYIRYTTCDLTGSEVLHQNDIQDLQQRFNEVRHTRRPNPSCSVGQLLLLSAAWQYRDVSVLCYTVSFHFIWPG